MARPSSPVVALERLGATDLARAGGKGANLGELCRAGLPVPPGFCVTTDGYRAFLATSAEARRLLERLAPGRAGAAGEFGGRDGTPGVGRDGVAEDATASARDLGDRLRAVLEATPVPAELSRAIVRAWRRAGAEHGYAVRSSATAEDLPGASFAGQQDTYLNVRGEEALLAAVRRCWASLFTERAILYRARNGFDHREVALAVVVQRMVDAEVAGILFTADPLSGDRLTSVIDAGFGLGEALVSGVVTADRFRVDRRRDAIVERQVSDKQMRIAPADGGGVERIELAAARRRAASLDDRQVLEITALGERIAAHFGRPQDVEWAYAGGSLYALQARPITSLFPLPEPRPSDGGIHLYFSFSHAQGLLEPMSPLGWSTWRVLVPFGRPPAAENPFVAVAAGRLYLDVAPLLRHPLGRRVLPTMLANADPLVAPVLRRLASEPGFRRRGRRTSWGALRRTLAPLAWNALAWLAWRRLDSAAPAVERRIDAFLAKAGRALERAAPGRERLHVAQDVLGDVFMHGAWHVAPIIAGGIVGYHLLRRWAPPGHEAEVAAISRGLAGNVTTEMDLRVSDLADTVRPHPELAALLARTELDSAARLERARALPVGRAFSAELESFLERYGMRGPAEIDVARPRWRNDPTSLLGMLASILQHDEPGADRARHAGLAEAGEEAGARLRAAASHGRWGRLRGPLVARLTRVVRTLPALREHPKYLLVRALDLVRPTLLDTGAMLTAAGRLGHPEDVWWLTMPELLAAADGLLRSTPATGPATDARSARLDDLRAAVERRRAQSARDARLTPPRLMTSDGIVPTLAAEPGAAPAGALAGNAVSPGVAEGSARVVLDPARAELRPGEILVAPFTDPGWTPLFTQAAGLVMEVGGLMTHGSVVAREYGLPAVVGVEHATSRIVTGQRIRVHGDEGFVELLEDEPGSG